MMWTKVISVCDNNKATNACELLSVQRSGINWATISMTAWYIEVIEVKIASMHADVNFESCILIYFKKVVSVCVSVNKDSGE